MIVVNTNRYSVLNNDCGQHKSLLCLEQWLWSTQTVTLSWTMIVVNTNRYSVLNNDCGQHKPLLCLEQ